jgi:hypothetical protein
VGAAAILIGALDLIPERFFILPGSGMIALGAYLAQTHGRRLVYRTGNVVTSGMTETD